MKGFNELRLNEAEMRVAVQEYLDKRMGQFAPEVVLVDCEEQHGVRRFQIGLAEKKAEESGDGR